ncbi:MAG: hypothetical protein ACLQDV_02220 [Candidatus Binataceae bacterium]
MLDQEAMQIARNRFAAESPRRHHFFHTELQRAQNDLVTKGQGKSGAFIQAVADVCAKEVEDAGDQLWEIVRGLARETKDTPMTKRSRRCTVKSTNCGYPIAPPIQKCSLKQFASATTSARHRRTRPISPIEVSARAFASTPR